MDPRWQAWYEQQQWFLYYQYHGLTPVAQSPAQHSYLPTPQRSNAATPVSTPTQPPIQYRPRILNHPQLLLNSPVPAYQAAPPILPAGLDTIKESPYRTHPQDQASKKLKVAEDALPFEINPRVLQCWEKLASKYGSVTAEMVGKKRTMLEIKAALDKSVKFDFEGHLAKVFRGKDHQIVVAKNMATLKKAAESEAILKKSKSDFKSMIRTKVGVEMIEGEKWSAREAVQRRAEEKTPGYREKWVEKVRAIQKKEATSFCIPEDRYLTQCNKKMEGVHEQILVELEREDLEKQLEKAGKLREKLTEQLEKEKRLREKLEKRMLKGEKETEGKIEEVVLKERGLEGKIGEVLQRERELEEKMTLVVEKEKRLKGKDKTDSDMDLDSDTE